MILPLAKPENDLIFFDMEDLINRIRTIKSFDLTDEDVAYTVVHDPVTAEDAFLALAAAKLLDKWAQEPLPTPRDGE